MKVTHFDTESRVVYLQLSRRNLLTLLAKLDQNAEEAVGALVEDRPMNLVALSKCTIVSGPYAAPGDRAPGVAAVTAVEDFDHYSDRPAGQTADQTELRLADEEWAKAQSWKAASS